MSSSYYYLSYSKQEIKQGLRIYIFPIDDADIDTLHFFEHETSKDPDKFFAKEDSASIEFVYNLIRFHDAKLFMINRRQAKIVCRNACLLKT